MAEEVSIANGDSENHATTPKKSTPTSKSGWDGKLRVNKQATLANPEALSDPEYSDEDATPPEEIDADEGKMRSKANSFHHADSIRPPRPGTS